jgi:hypothetical protein
LPDIPEYQKSSCAGSGSGVFIAEEIDGVGNMG